MIKKHILLVVLGIVMIIFVIDFSLILIFKTRPLFAISGNVYKDGGSREYYGVGYKVLKCKTLSGDNSVKIGFYNMKYSCDTSKIKETNYQINDDIKIYYKERSREELQLAVIEPIYQDDEYKYVMNNEYSYIIYKKNQITYKEAIERKLITIDDLIKAGVQIFKEKKEVKNNEIIDTSKCSFINTLKVISVLNYQSQDNETKYLVVDFFQGSIPFIIKTKLNTNDLINNQYYEFTFNGYKKDYVDDDNLSLFDVIRIEKTNKVGFDQINESCN